MTTAKSVEPGEGPPPRDDLDLAGLDLSGPNPRSVFGRLFDAHAGSLHGAADLAALGTSEDGERQEIILDLATSEVIGERKVSDSMFVGIPRGTVTSYSSVTTGVVDGIGVKPAS